MMKLLRKPSKAELHNLLDRGVTNVVDRAHLESALNSGRQLRIKLGIDPTSSELHLGHGVVLRKLRLFQELGHKAVLIIGDFTAVVGDPSGRVKARIPLTRIQVAKNMKTYLGQAYKILSKKNVEIRYNSEWLKKLNFTRLFELAGLISLNQILERDDFQKRLRQHQSIRTYELFYPILQAYDSVMIKADIELGGNDQLFNLLLGRDLMEKLNMAPQYILTASLLEGTDGKEKMSKSLGNCIALTDAPNDMFGKLMSVRDELIEKYFLLCTDVPEDEIKKIQNGIKAGKLNPRDAKLRLAREIVGIYHGEKVAKKAEEEFTNVFSKKELPSKIPQFKMGKPRDVVYILVKSGTSNSKSDAWRLIKQGAVTVEGRVITNPKHQIHEDCVLQIGKKRFIKTSFKK